MSSSIDPVAATVRACVRWRVVRPLLVLLSVYAALAASASAADGVKQVESLTSGETISDGVRFVSWTHGADVRVLDDRTGDVASFPLPEGCSPPSALSGGYAAAVCGTGIRLLDVGSGAWNVVPATEATAPADSVS